MVTGSSLSIHWTRRAWRVLPALVFTALALAVAGCGSPPVATEAPEAATVLAAQSKMPFQIMIPAFLPEAFQRADVAIKLSGSGPGGEPMVELVYKTKEGASVTLQEWVPVNPDLEILSASRPIQTKWGRAWHLKQGDSLSAMWVDVGPTRVSVFTADLDVLSDESLLSVAETLGPASNKVVFSFKAEPTKIKAMAPPKPFKVPVNKQGVQAITLVVTPGGYSPLRFAVKKDVPVKLTFRQLGEVGCGNEIIYPSDPTSPVSLQLESAGDQKVLDYTPKVLGTFEFKCSHLMYRGLVTVTK